MGKTLPNLLRPAHPEWEIAVTRISRHVFGRVASCLQDLSIRLATDGLKFRSETRLGPRGMAMVLAASTPRDVLFELEYTLIDGMLTSGHPGAALEVLLLDAEGYVLTVCSPSRPPGPARYHLSSDQILAASDSCLIADAVYEVIADHFDLAQYRPTGDWPR